MGRGGLMNLLPGLKRTRPVLIIAGWGLLMSGAVLSAIFQGFLLPSTYYGGSSGTLPLGVWFPYLEVLGASILAGIVMGDAGKTILSFFASYGLAAVVTYLVLAMPGIIGAFPVADLLTRQAAVITFTALFPIPLLVGFLGSVVGSALSERLL